jgi:hypothetical protein
MTTELQKYYDPTDAKTCSLCQNIFPRGFSVIKLSYFVMNEYKKLLFQPILIFLIRKGAYQS